MKNVVTLVLGGGRGTRLYPLTKFRSKPAVPIAGKYRLIDIPLSNCINSGLNRIYVLTQFNSVSLHHHIGGTYSFDAFDRGFVELLAAQQTIASTDWYQGTADAVRQNLRYLQEADVDKVLILSGDQLYRMDFRQMLATHEQSRADVTIAAVPVHSSEAAALGIMRLDDTGRVEGFLEKPQTEEELELVRTDPAWIDAYGVPSRGRDCLARFFPPRSAPATSRSISSTATGKTSARSSRSTKPTCGWPPPIRPLSWPHPGHRSTAAPASCRRRGWTASRSAPASWPTAA